MLIDLNIGNIDWNTSMTEVVSFFYVSFLLTYMLHAAHVHNFEG